MKNKSHKIDTAELYVSTSSRQLQVHRHRPEQLLLEHPCRKRSLQAITSSPGSRAGGIRMRWGRCLGSRCTAPRWRTCTASCFCTQEPESSCCPCRRMKTTMRRSRGTTRSGTSSSWSSQGLVLVPCWIARATLRSGHVMFSSVTLMIFFFFSFLLLECWVQLCGMWLDSRSL